MQSFMRFLVRSNIRRIKRAGRELSKSMKITKEKKHRGSSTVYSHVDNSSVVAGGQTVGKEITEGRSGPDVVAGTTREREIEREVPRKRYDEDQMREDAWAAIGELSVVSKKIIYWTNQTQVQEVLWHAIESETDRYVKHILETVLAQVERTPEPEIG